MEITIHSSRLRRDVSGKLDPHEVEDYTRLVRTLLNGAPKLNITRVRLVLAEDLPTGLEWRIEVKSAPSAADTRVHIMKRFKTHLRHPKVVDGSDVEVTFLS